VSFFNKLNKMLNEVSQATLDKVTDKFVKQGEEETKVKDYLARFNELSLKQRLKGIDIMSFKTFKDLQQMIDKVSAEKSKTQTKQEISLKDADKIYEDDHYLVISPKTYEASCKYGKGTKWCISSISTSDHWNSYSNKNNIKFYFIINKQVEEESPEEEKVAIAVYPEGQMNAYDATDYPINAERYIKYTGLDINLFKPKELTEEDVLNGNVEGTWKKNEDGTYDVEGSVQLSNKNFQKLPLRFNIVTKDFLCDQNQLTSLEGVPKEVGENFWCSENRLTSLEGGPIKVGGYYACHTNRLKTLDGIAKEIGMGLNCSVNDLTSLKGCPKKIRVLLCQYNKLTSLENGPEKIDINLNIQANGLTSLKGCPKEIGGNFNCSDNQLTSLEGGPIKVGYHFDCSENELITLEGAPKEVGRDFNCRDNAKKFTEEDVRKVCNVKGRVSGVYEFPSDSDKNYSDFVADEVTDEVADDIADAMEGN
jgi:hypothetical protein